MSVVTNRFFELILPSTGWRCLFTLPDKRHHWYQTNEEITEAALRLDAQGFAVFHGCATFDDRERKQNHVEALQCFRFDIDAGPGKPYADAGAAYGALEAWRGVAALPAAMVVSSGGGLHAYWPLRDPLDRRQWEGAAHRLRALAEAHGLHVDPSATVDAARILRPPGTHNRKLLDAGGKKLADVGGDPRPVVVGPQAGPYTLEDLGLNGAASEHGLTLGEVPAFLKGQKDDIALHKNDTAFDESDLEQVAARCGQFAHLHDARSRGADPASGWFPFYGILAHCGEAGRAYASKIVTDPQWTPTVLDKIERWREKGMGPTTCAQFSALNPGPCILCPHNGRVTSPIQLGRDLPAAAVAPAPSRLELPVLPKGFKWSGMRLMAERKPTDEDPSDSHVISEYPVVIDELQETERTQRVSVVIKSWEPMRQDWRDFSLGLGEVVGQGGPAKIADRGVIVPKKRWDQFVAFTNACATEHRGTKHYGVRYEQFGWKQTPEGPAYVLGERLFRAGVEPVSIHGSDELERRGKQMVPTGEAEKWSAAANQLIGRPGMEAHAFMLLCAFAAPLYYFTGEAGATLVHGVSAGSGKGKSTMLNAGASIYGPLEATSIIERDTMVAKFITLGTLCHLPVFFDELRFRDPDDTKHYVLQTTIGRDKQRGKVDGGLRSDQYGWSTIHISAANTSIVDTVRFDGAEVAQASRVFEFSLALPEGAKTTDGDALTKVLRANTGTAGVKFIQTILDNYDWVARAVPEQMRRYEQEMQAGPEERFILRLFACVAIAGVLVAKAGLLKIDLKAIMAWAVDVQKGNAHRLAVEGAIDASTILSQMINDLAANTIVMPAPPTVGRPETQQVPIRDSHGELKARIEVMGRRMLIDVLAVRKWMQEKNYSFSEIQKQLLGLGVLKDARKRATLAAGSGRSIGQTWNWLIDGMHPLLQDLIDAVTAPENNVVQLRGTK